MTIDNMNLFNMCIYVGEKTSSLLFISSTLFSSNPVWEEKEKKKHVWQDDKGRINVNRNFAVSLGAERDDRNQMW